MSSQLDSWGSGGVGEGLSIFARVLVLSFLSFLQIKPTPLFVPIYSWVTLSQPSVQLSKILRENEFLEQSEAKWNKENKISCVKFLVCVTKNLARKLLLFFCFDNIYFVGKYFLVKKDLDLIAFLVI